MVPQSLRSGWLAAALTFILCLTVLAQTEPSIPLTWDLIPDPRAVNYRVQTTVGSLPFITAKECSAPPCIVTGIDGVVTYKIIVAGLEADGKEGEYSASIEFMFASVQPLSPTSVSVSSATSTPSGISKKLSWPAVTKFRTGPAFPAGTVVEYHIYQAGTGTLGTGSIVVATSNTNSYTVQGLEKYKSYQFWVTCVVNDIESYTSPAVRVNT